MASGTVGYTDTRGKKDYTSIIANQIGKRLKEASDMAADERSFAEGKAEEGGTSLEEAGIGKGYFFKRALGNRFGGDRIARTKGRMGMGGDANNPAANYKQRFRGGFDYNITNQIQNSADIVPLSNALVVGLRGVEQGLSDVAGAIQRQGTVLNSLSRNQADMAKATMFNGYLFAMFQSQQKQREGRESLRREEASIEGRSGGRIGGSSYGGAGGGRGMINVTGSSPSGSSGGGGGLGLSTIDTAQTATKLFTNPKGAKSVGKGTAGVLTGMGLSYPVKLLQTAGKGIRNLLPDRLGKGKSASALMKRGSQIITGDTAIQLELIESMNPFFTKLGGKGAMEIFDGSDTKHLLQLSLLDEGFDEAMANTFASASKNADGKAVQVLEDLMFKHNAKSIKPTDALELLDFIKAGGLTSGMPMDEKNALARLEQIIGPEDFADLTDGISAPLKNADVPLQKLIPETVAHKTAKKAAAKSAAKLTGKSVLKSVAKKIPLIAGLAGIAFGIQRALEGDLLGAGLEITSGILGATGVAAGPSFGIDAFLLARDLGMMPMRTGGTIYPGRTNSMLNVGGKMFSFNEPGNKEVVRVEKDNDNRDVEMGIGIVEGFKKKRSEYVALQATGVENALGSLKGSGFFSGLFSTVQDLGNNVKNLNPTKGIFDGFLQWFNKGAKPGENNMKWFGKDSLLSDDWKQRGKFGKKGKLGGWDITRGFRPGVSAEEGGIMSGPTPAVRQAVKRTFGFLSSFRGGGLATLASLVANEFINPQPLADGTMDGYMNSIGENSSMKLQNNDSNAGVAATVINNNYYNSGGTSGGQESGNETLGQSFNGDLEKFITGYSIMSK